VHCNIFCVNAEVAQQHNTFVATIAKHIQHLNGIGIPRSSLHQPFLYPASLAAAVWFAVGVLLSAVRVVQAPPA
jgi:hypothetical protein